MARASRPGATPVALSLFHLESEMKYTQNNMISVRLDDDLLAELDRFCEEEDRNRVNAIRRFIKLGLKAAQEKESE